MKDKIISFFRDVTKELKKNVTWPTKEELKESTYVVVFVCILFALFTYTIDFSITKIFSEIFGK